MIRTKPPKNKKVKKETARKNRRFDRGGVSLSPIVQAQMGKAKKQLAQRELARRGLFDFTKYTYPRYRVSQHNLLMCDVIDKWVAGEIPRLMIFTPPRNGKSELVSRRLPPYLMGKFPGAQIILTSYASDLAEEMSRASKEIVRSQRYQNVFSGCTIRKDKDKVDDWAFEPLGGAHYEGSSYLCAGVDGPITGRGMRFGIIDDPVKNRKEAESLTMRDTAWNWYRSTFYTRLAPDASILLVMTRWHDDDLAGRLIQMMLTDPNADQWYILVLPAMSYGVRGPWDKDDPTSGPDPLGRPEGHALWPSAFNKKRLESIRTNVGPYDWEALYQQRPRPPGGDKIQAEWFSIVDWAPLNPPSGWVRFWDLAVSSKTSADFTCSYRMCIGEDGYIYLADEVRGQWLWPEARNIIKETCEREEKLGVYIGIEEAGQQKGFINDLQTMPELARFAIQGIPVDGDKLVRSQPWIGRAEQGLVRMVLGPWNQPCKEELKRFTGKDDIHDDRVDSIAGGYNMLANEAVGFSVEDLDPPPRSATGDPGVKEVKKALEEKGFAPDAIQRVMDNMNIRPPEDLMQDERVWQ